jgi:outer membrane receptor protein involved in Fe transport
VAIVKINKLRHFDYGVRVFAVLVFLFVFCCWGLPLLVDAQGSGGTILGTVSDPSGAAVTGATVRIKNTATAEERIVISNEGGFYTAPNLVPGVYELSINSTGFAPTVIRDVVLTIGEEREINVQLTIGPVTQDITVSAGQISDVQVASSSVGNIVDSQTVVELPLNGRDWTALTQLEPGVAQVRTQKALGINNDRANRGLGVEVTIGGNRPQQNNYRLDGVSINDYASGAPGSIQGSVLGVDAVQEFSVVTSNAPADYGKTSGGVINAVSRSGSNSLHGTAYEFLRNSALDTRNFFDGLTVPAFKRNQFGGSAGGPIIKDRTFFFADYEGVRQSQGVTTVDDVPSQAARNGTLCSMPQPNCTTKQLPVGLNTDANGVDLATKPYLALFPLPNGVLSANGDTGKFSFVANVIAHEDFVTTRIDHKLSASDSLFGTYLFDKGNTASPDVFNFKNIGNLSRRHTVALEETHIFTNALLNTARFGFNRTFSSSPTTLSAINSAAADNALGFDPGQPVGLISVTGLTQFQGGIGSLGEYDFHYNSYQFYDDIFWTRSKHSLKFGFYTERIQSNQLTRGTNPNGQYFFGGLQTFLQNQPTSFNTWLSKAISPRDLRQSIYGGYVQDDYKMRPNLTLNLGLRYEMVTVPMETTNKLTTLVHPTDATPKLGSPYFSNPTFRNFEPRVGFSWDPFGTGKTAVRGAFGIYDVLPLPYQFALLSLLAAPFAQAGNISYANAAQAQGQFPKNSFNQLNASTLRNAFIEQNPHRNYVEQWSLNVQRQLLPTFTLDVGYIGSHGVHQPFHPDDFNDVQPTLTPAGWAWPANPAGTLRLNPAVGQISAVAWSVSSSYHALSVKAIKRPSHGLQIQSSYTFAKSIDNSSSGIAGDTFGNSVSSLPFFDPRLTRGLSDFDVRNLGVVNAIYTLPIPRSWSGVAKLVAGGWETGGIYTLSSGLPITATLGGDPLGLKAADVYAFPNRVAGCDPVNSNFKSNLHYVNTACFTFPPSNLPSNTTVPRLIGNAGRNTVEGPGLNEFDFSLYKNTPIPRISERFHTQFRWEVFNLFNHANFNPPTPSNRQIFASSGVLNSNAGLLNSTSTSSRQIQFAWKFIW